MNERDKELMARRGITQFDLDELESMKVGYEEARQYVRRLEQELDVAREAVEITGTRRAVYERELFYRRYPDAEWWLEPENWGEAFRYIQAWRAERVSVREMIRRMHLEDSPKDAKYVLIINWGAT